MSTNTNRVCTVEKDIEKFIKFLALKSVQVVVQSRLGEKIQTQCNPNASGNNWFNIVIQDHPDVLHETKKALAINAGDSILNRLPLCVEISLQTVEGDKMILEVWSLGIHTEQSDSTLRATHAIYNRMGILLKSLISVTRATPTYKLSRRQSSDSYHIYYRIYVGEPQTHNLGEGLKQVRVGQLSTTLGTLNMSVAYRTKMTISPTQTGRDNTIMLKSDHFLKDLSPKHVRYHHIKKSEKKIIDIEKPLRPGAFADTTKLTQFTEEDYILPETPPFSWLIRKTKEESSQETSVEDDKSSSNNLNSPTDEKNTNNSVIAAPGSTATTTTVTAAGTTFNNINNNNNNNNNTEFKSLESNEINKGQQNSQGSQKDISGTSPIRSLLTAATIPLTLNKDSDSSKRSSRNSKMLPPEDENLMKELHFPFASPSTHMGDLAKFYRDCYNAPPLQSYDETPPEKESVIEDLSKQLEEFEISLDDYDSLVTSLDCPSLDSNSNS